MAKALGKAMGFGHICLYLSVQFDQYSMLIGITTYFFVNYVEIPFFKYASAS